MATVQSKYKSIQDFYAKNWLEHGFHKVKLRHGQYNTMPNWRWKRSGRRWITMMGGTKLAVSRDGQNGWKYELAHYPPGCGGGSDGSFATRQEAMDNAGHGYGASLATDELRRLKAKLSGLPCSHKHTVPDLVDWVERCVDCRSVLRDIGQAEGNRIFNRMTGIST